MTYRSLEGRGNRSLSATVNLRQKFHRGGLTDVRYTPPAGKSKFQHTQHTTEKIFVNRLGAIISPTKNIFKLELVFMILTVDNVAKIDHAKIELNGITVIAGENNTGKSTVGKILYCLLNAFFDINHNIYNEKFDKISRELFLSRRITNINKLNEFFYSSYSNKNFINTILEYGQGQLGKNDKVIDHMYSLFLSTLKINPNNAEEEKKLKDVVHRIAKIAFADISSVKNALISRQFAVEFKDQINNINDITVPASISLSLNGEADVDAEVVFESNKCTQYTEDFVSLLEAIYIDTPFVIDDAPNQFIFPREDNSDTHKKRLSKKLFKPFESSFLDEAINKAKLDAVQEILSSVVLGSFVSGEDNDRELFAFKEEDFKAPLRLSNLSTGLKTFVIIKRLLENGSITTESVLILDEPEIHLHPAWQLAFAEILTLLQKEFNLIILLNTHSPYFLSAIEVYSKKYNIKEKCKYYLAEVSKDCANFKDVTENTEPIYQKLAFPFQTLENISYGED